MSADIPAIRARLEAATPHTEAILTQWETSAREKLRASREDIRELLADNARLAKKVGRVEVLCALRWRQVHLDIEGFVVVRADDILAALADPTTEETT